MVRARDVYVYDKDLDAKVDQKKFESMQEESKVTNKVKASEMDTQEDKEDKVMSQWLDENMNWKLNGTLDT